MKRLDLFEISLISAGFLVPLVWAEVNAAGFKFNIVDLVVPLMLAGFFLRAKRDKLSLIPGVSDKLFLVLLVWAAFSLPRAIDLAKSLREFTWLAESGLVFYMVGHGVKDDASMGRLLKAWCYGAVAVALLGILEYLTSLLFGGGPIRIHIPLLAYNSVAGYLIVFIPILISFKYGSLPNQRVYWGILAIIVSAALVFTLTRGGWYATLIALMLLAVLLKDRLLPLYVIIFAALCFWAVPMANERAVSSLSPAVDNTSVYRMQLWQVGLQMWQDRPLAGVGIGNYYLLHDSYLARFPQLDRGGTALEPHNSFIKFLAENGLVGLVVFVALLGSVVLRTVTMRSKLANSKLYPMVAGTFCGLAAFLVQSNTNSLFHLPRVAFSAWLIIGVIYGINQRNAVPEPQQQPVRPSLHPVSATWLNRG